MYSLAMMSLYLLRDKPQYSTLSELVYTMDKESFLNFISVFGGTTIYVPTAEEVEESLKVIMYYYYTEVEEMSHDEARLKLGVSSEDNARSLAAKCRHIKPYIDEFRFRKRDGDLWEKEKNKKQK